jgi:hypothetical protein
MCYCTLLLLRAAAAHCVTIWHINFAAPYFLNQTFNLLKFLQVKDMDLPV